MRVKCKACGLSFWPRPQCPKQSYCSKPDCQRERKRLWLRQKRALDPDYRENQSKAQRRWLDQNPHYWSQYRREHPAYAARNRSLQRVRNGRDLAKIDAKPPQPALPTGLYVMRSVPGRVAKSDAWIIEITALGHTRRVFARCKETTSSASADPAARFPGAI